MTIAIKKIEIAKKVLEEQDEEILNRLDAILAKNAELSMLNYRKNMQNQSKRSLI
jgi:hypothetical protein